MKPKTEEAGSTSHADGAPLPDQHPSGHWSGIPQVSLALSITSTILSIIGVLPIILTLIAERPFISVENGLFVALFVGIIVHAVLGISLARELVVQRRQYSGLQAQFIELERQHQSSEHRCHELETARASYEVQAERRKLKELVRARAVRNIGELRSRHSSFMHQLHFAASSLGQGRAGEVLELASRTHLQYLDNFCNLTTELFPNRTIEPCCTNIKLVSCRREAQGELPLMTDYGVDLHREHADAVYSRVVARCSISQNDKRGSRGESEPRIVSDNLILRRPFERNLSTFFTSDIEKNIEEWSGLVGRDGLAPFRYPDRDTGKYYRSLMVCPLHVPPLERSAGSSSSTSVHLLFGYLSIDSFGDLDFRESDVTFVEGMAESIVSAMLEYRGLVSSLNSRK